MKNRELTGSIIIQATYRSRIRRITIRNSQGWTRRNIIYGRNLTVPIIIKCNLTVRFGGMIEHISHGCNQFGTFWRPDLLEASEGDIVCLFYHHVKILSEKFWGSRIQQKFPKYFDREETHPLRNAIILNRIKLDVSSPKRLNEGIVICLFSWCKPSSVGWEAGEAIVCVIYTLYNKICK